MTHDFVRFCYSCASRASHMCYDPSFGGAMIAWALASMSQSVCMQLATLCKVSRLYTHARVNVCLQLQPERFLEQLDKSQKQPKTC